MPNVLRYLLLFTAITSYVQAKNIFTSGENLESNGEWKKISNRVFTYFNIVGGRIWQIYYIRLDTGIWHVTWVGGKQMYEIIAGGHFRSQNNNVFVYRDGDTKWCHNTRRSTEIRITCGPENILKRVIPTARNGCQYTG
eukprot:229971_1